MCQNIIIERVANPQWNLTLEYNGQSNQDANLAWSMQQKSVFVISIGQSAGAVEHTDCISVEG